MQHEVFEYEHVKTHPWPNRYRRRPLKFPSHDLLASLVGLIDQGQLPPTDPRRVYINNHITAGVVLIIINGLLLYLHLRWPDVLTRHRWPYLGLMALGLVTVLAAAWLGGELVYRWHIGIIE